MGNFIKQVGISEQEILDTVHEYGVCVLPNFLSAEEIKSLKTEFDTFFSGDDSLATTDHGSRGYLEAKTLKYDQIDQNIIPNMRQLVDRPMFKSLTEKFYNGDYIYPQKLYIIRSTENEDYVPTELPYCTHVDRIQMLKFFFFLKDVELKDGPPGIIPGTQKELKEGRLQWIREKKDPKYYDNVIKGRDHEIVPLVGPAGTLAVLDTDVAHVAGRVYDNGLREVIRIDTASESYSGVSLYGKNDRKGILKRLFSKK